MQASSSRPEFARDSASSFAENPSPSEPSTTEGKENQLGKSGSAGSGLFSKYKGKYKTYLAERRANSKSRASQDLDSVAESAISANNNNSRRSSAKETPAAAQAADNAALDKDMEAFFAEVSQIKVRPIPSHRQVSLGWWQSGGMIICPVTCSMRHGQQLRAKSCIPAKMSVAMQDSSHYSGASGCAHSLRQGLSPNSPPPLSLQAVRPSIHCWLDGSQQVDAAMWLVCASSFSTQWQRPAHDLENMLRCTRAQQHRSCSKWRCCKQQGHCLLSFDRQQIWCGYAAAVGNP